MKVRCVVSFTSLARGEMDVWPVGRVGEMPPGENWIELGWVVPVEAEAEVEQELEPDRPRSAKRPAKKKVSDGG